AAGLAAAGLWRRGGFQAVAVSGIQPGSFLPPAFFPRTFFVSSRFVAGLPFPAPVLPRPLPRLLGAFAIAGCYTAAPHDPVFKALTSPALHRNIRGLHPPGWRNW